MTKQATKLRDDGTDETAADIARVPVTRFTTGDIDQYKGWLFPKLRRMFPDTHDRILMGWLRGVAENNEINSMKAKHAVGMAQVSRQPLTPIPTVRELFVFIEDESDDAKIDGAAIYKQFGQWAASMGVHEILLVDQFSDVPRDYKEAAVTLQDRQITVMKVG